ncbi:hypothetical protein [Agrobacterium rosae]|uniref:hypothetical protein n=1 Tax=Agrobacterium rosae TaxID=1972867 RepID=UPI0012D3CC4F|nr:hypothetical protein [Agrobacterium rosae]
MPEDKNDEDSPDSRRTTAARLFSVLHFTLLLSASSTARLVRGGFFRIPVNKRRIG